MKKNFSGFSLLEITIVIALIVSVAVAVLVGLNPLGQINKGQDSKRKHELAQLNKALEDWYNDKSCYPKPSEICYPNNIGGYNPASDPQCYICGNQAGSPIFSYLPQIPCDPSHPTKKYLYQVDNLICPSWYRVYTSLSNITDPSIPEVGCEGGCPSNASYNYGTTSTNIGL